MDRTRFKGDAASDPRWESLFADKRLRNCFRRKVGNGVLQLALHTLRAQSPDFTGMGTDTVDQVRPTEGRDGLEYDPLAQSEARRKLRDTLRCHGRHNYVEATGE